MHTHPVQPLPSLLSKYLTLVFLSGLSGSLTSVSPWGRTKKKKRQWVVPRDIHFTQFHSYTCMTLFETPFLWIFVFRLGRIDEALWFHIWNQRRHQRKKKKAHVLRIKSLHFFIDSRQTKRGFRNSCGPKLLEWQRFFGDQCESAFPMSKSD